MVVNDQWFNIEENQAFGLVSLVSLADTSSVSPVGTYKRE
jgi:hypothetical protein